MGTLMPAPGEVTTTVTEAAVIMERDNPMRSRGFGFVTFDDADVAQVRLPPVAQRMAGVDGWLRAAGGG